MRHILPILAAAALTTALPSSAAEPHALWGTSTFSGRGGGLVPGAAQPAAVDSAGNVIVVATQGDAANACIVTVKYGQGNGAMRWRKEACGGAGTFASAVAVDGAGDVLVAGSAGGDFRILKYGGENGVLLWEQRSGGTHADAGFGIAVDRNGDVFMLGSAPGFTVDLWVTKHRGADGALVWQQPVESGADTTPAGLAVDGSGHALVVGTYRNSRGDEDWHLAKLAGSSGAVLWRKVYDTGGRDVAVGLAVDAAGDPTVAGTSSVASGATVMRTVKSAGATGRTLWDQSHAGAGNAGAGGVRTDGSGNVIVTGFAAEASGHVGLRTIKYAGGDGAQLWEATHAGSAAGPGMGRAVAVDGFGNVAITGRSFTHGPAAEIRTIKYSASGAQTWSAAHGGGSAGDSGLAVMASSGALYAVGATTEGGQSAVRVMKYVDVAVPARPAALNVQGLWWRGAAESGWGVNLTQQGDILFATWFTYDAQGQPMWLVMSEGHRTGDDEYAGTLYRTSGPAFNAQPFDPARVQATPVGKATLRFSDADNGVFAYEVGSASGSKAITRQVYSSPVPRCAQGASAAAAPNFQDLWWAPAGAESGWGLNIAHQGDTLFITWFTYAGDGRATWLVGSNVARTGNATYSGTLYRTVGPPFDAQPWSAAQVAVAAAGQATLVFTDANNGTFSYTLDGFTQSKAITRQVYATPKTTCR